MVYAVYTAIDVSAGEAPVSDLSFQNPLKLCSLRESGDACLGAFKLVFRRPYDTYVSRMVDRSLCKVILLV